MEHTGGSDLEAIDRSSDLTQRGVRGVIAEAAFDYRITTELFHWRKAVVYDDLPYDFLLEDAEGAVRVQVKMQRRKDHRPMFAREGYRRLPANMYVVETQRTRKGEHVETGADTRPYRFGEFDILAVSMHPSTGNWNDFMFTVADWLLPRPEDESLLLKFQPVSRTPSLDWTNDFDECVRWWRSGYKKRLSLNL
ncbi:hypothetical protein HC891_27330 [Candidatus Gracilibacteria bacterium]|nr:hypothetical protein [Candidatus Gracilibacteria bacterium]